MTVAAVSALTGRPVDGSAAVTGEISVQGKVLPVGGVPAKAEAARRSGLARVLAPRENAMERFRHADIQMVLVDTVQQVLSLMLLPAAATEESADGTAATFDPLAAAPLPVPQGTRRTQERSIGI
jgi:Lon-like ATP-dependent protease